MIAEMSAIKTAYEVEGMSPEEIAQDRGFDVAAVKAGLMQYSSKYQKACGKEEEAEEELNFSNEQLQRVNDVIFELAMGAEDPHLRFKAATYVRDDKKGRKEVIKNVAGNNFNVLMINQQLARVAELAEVAKSKALPAPPLKRIPELVNV